MRIVSLLALAALLPAATNATAAARPGDMQVALCTGDGVARTISIPAGAPKLPGSDPGLCCAKGCHSGSSRKRMVRT